MKQIPRRNFFALLGGLAAALLGAKTQAKAGAPTGLKRFEPLRPANPSAKPVYPAYVAGQPIEKAAKYPCAIDYTLKGEAGTPGMQIQREPFRPSAAFESGPDKAA